eukprot:gene23886-28983_t
MEHVGEIVVDAAFTAGKSIQHMPVAWLGGSHIQMAGVAWWALPLSRSSWNILGATTGKSFAPLNLLFTVDQAADGANTEKAAAVVDVWLSKQWDTDKGVRCGVIELFNSDFVSAALLLDSQPLAWGVLLKVAPYSTRPATTLSDGTSAPVLSGIEAVDTSVQNLKRACEASLGDGEPAINACTEAIDHNDQEWVQPDPGLLTAAADPPSARQLMLGKRPRAEGESTSAQAPELQLQVARATEMKHT